MIDAPALLKDLKRLLKSLEADIRQRAEQDLAARAALEAEWGEAKAAGRTAATFASWLDEEVTQAAAHWILACVFLRFVEDNGLVERPFLSGPGERLHLARDRHEQFFHADPRAEERDFLHACFREGAALPGLGALFADTGHNPLWRLPVSGDGAIALRDFFQRTDPDTGTLYHDFTDERLETRFLGDLYQDLSDTAKKRFALLQTPEFVEEFILDRTLDPAIREFGYREVRLIDPACGSGHFLLGAFRRLFDLWTRHEPARNLRDCAQRALDAVHGVDINPFAVAIARFRLLVAALIACNIKRLRDAPDFRIGLATGDSLLHGRRFIDTRGWQQELRFTAAPCIDHVYYEEDRAALNRILGRQYHAVVGNPPYITVKDKALNEAYRQRYFTCHMKYSLAVPFTERFLDLSIPGDNGSAAGFVGMITANSFMKREFGKKLIEQCLPRVDVTHVIDTSGAYIPGHGTPTVILFARNRWPIGELLRVVMGIKGEPATPSDPGCSLVWRAIIEQIDIVGSESAFVSVADVLRPAFSKHPWSIGGGGAAELKKTIEAAASSDLGSECDSIGFMAITGGDELFVATEDFFRRQSIPSSEFTTGDDVRDWGLTSTHRIIAPYEDRQVDRVRALADLGGFAHLAWTTRTTLRHRLMFGKTPEEAGLEWWEYRFASRDRILAHRLVSFACVATHNHFVLDRGGKVFNRHAPVIKLQGTDEDEHLSLLGLLNSSTACFWMKQVFHNRGSTIDERGARQRTAPFEDFFEFAGTGLKQFPIPRGRPLELSRKLDGLAKELSEIMPEQLLSCGLPSPTQLDAARERAHNVRASMIAFQEELDWGCYRLYGVLDIAPEHPDPPPLALGERAFEIVMARQMAEGELETSWFERHGSTPITDIPTHWPPDYRLIVERRIQLIEDHRDISILERPEYKRRWQWTPWQEREQQALRSWLLDRLEDARYWRRGEPALVSVKRLSDLARSDDAFMRVAQLYTARMDFDVAQLVAELVGPESAPYLPGLRYSETGLRKRAEWEKVWELQRREDTIDERTDLSSEQQAELKAHEIGDISMPPKYQRADFRKSDFWRLRGGLDVPRERFVSYPGAERGADGSLVITWAGYNHLEQAQALGAHYVEMKDREGWSIERLLPLLAGIGELVPWLKQWHNDYNAAYATRLGNFYEGFVVEQAKALGRTVNDIEV